MKLRIRGNSLRFRLTQAEVAALAAGQTVSEVTVISVMQQFRFSLMPWHLELPGIQWQHGDLNLSVPEKAVGAWAANQEEGLYWTIDNQVEGGLRIAVEKDYACLKTRDGEDETDNYPHPQGMKC